MSDNRDAFTKWWDESEGNYRGSAAHKAIARRAWEAGMREAAGIADAYSSGFSHGETAGEWQAIQEACAAILSAIEAKK